MVPLVNTADGVFFPSVKRRLLYGLTHCEGVGLFCLLCFFGVPFRPIATKMITRYGQAVERIGPSPP